MCDRLVESNVTGFTVFPLDGSDGVPVNATPFVVGADLEAVLLDASGNPIPAQIQDLLVLGEFGTQQIVRRLIPDVELPEGSLVQVQSDGSIVSTFTVGAGADTDAPVVDAALDETEQGSRDSTGFECGYQSFARIGVAGEDAAFFVGVKDGQPEFGGAVRFDGATSTDQLFVFGEGGATVNVAGVDLAGNVGAAVPVEVEFPELSCASGGMPLVLALCALLVRVKAAARRK